MASYAKLRPVILPPGMSGIVLMKTAQESKQPLPVARSRNLIVRELSDETLIYDLETDEAHYLNQTAALVWKNCDGTRDIHQLLELIEKASSFVVTEDVVWLALKHLKKFRLLETDPETLSPATGINRRELVRRFGVAMSLPLIISIVAPAAQAQGTQDCRNQSCVTDAECCPQNPECGSSQKCK